MGRIRLRAQLTYASFEAQGRGGWQVKDVVGRMEPDEKTAIVSNIPTILPTPGAGRFVTADEAAQWPRRLVYQSIQVGEERIPTLMHSASAGQDRSGRAGNVFTHCAVPDGPVGRPAFAWRSPSWLTPFGIAAVEATTLDADGSIDLDEQTAGVSAFLSEGDVWRPGILAVLLDALSARLRGVGPVVVLLVADTDEAALWAQAVSACMGSRTAGTFHFSTFENLSLVRGNPGFHLMCALHDARDAVARLSDAVVIDSAKDPTLGVLGEAAHLTEGGVEVAVTAWSALMFEEVAMAVDLDHVVAELDALVGAVPGEDSNDPAWWLAIRTYLSADAEFDPAIVKVVARAAPSGAAANAEIAGAVQRALLSTMGTSTPERWRELTAVVEGGGSNHLRALATGAYLESAFADPRWLSNAAEVVPPYLPPRPTGDTARRARSLATRLEDLDMVHRGRATLRFMDLVDRLGWVDVLDIAAAVESTADAALVPLFADPARFAMAWDAHAPHEGRTLTLAREVASMLAPTRHIDDGILDRLGVASLEYLAGGGGLEADQQRLTPLGLRIVERLSTEPSRVAQADRQALDFWVEWAAAQQRSQGWRPNPRQGVPTLTPRQCLTLVRQWGGNAVSDEVMIRSILSSHLADAWLLPLLDLAQAGGGRQWIRLAVAYSQIVSGDWSQPHQLACVRDTFKTVTAAAQGAGLELDRTVRSILWVQATCALVASPDLDFAEQVRTVLKPIKPSEEIIRDGVRLFLASLRGGAGANGWVTDALDYIVDQRLLAGDAVRAHLLAARPSDADSIVERLIRAALLHRAVNAVDIDTALEDYRPQLDDRTRQSLAKSARQWLRDQGILERAGVSTIFKKRTGGQK